MGAASWLCAGLATGALLGCGSRTDPFETQLPERLDVSQLQPQCFVDTDCELADLCVPRRCVENACVDEPVFCDDADPCTDDGCDSATGVCAFEPVTSDQDGDGHPRPLPGFEPGAQGACGDDCNDQSALASPEGVERCDGLDNDCDGVVDNGALFSPSVAPAIQLSLGAEQGTVGGLTFSDSDGAYGAVFTQRLGASQNTFTRILPHQGGAGMAVPVTEVNSDTFAGPIVGRDRIFATAWEDRRDEDYEIYFNRLNTQGQKLGPDLRISAASGFSLRPTLLEVPSARGEVYRLAWEDERDGSGGRIYGQKLDGAGELDGDNIELSELGLDPSSPSLVLGQTRLGLLFNLSTATAFNNGFGGGGGRGIGFRSFDYDFEDATPLVILNAESPDAATITANAGQFVVAWHTVQSNFSPGPQIWGSIISETGEEIVSPKPLTAGADFARYHSIVPLGDRLILLWSEWRDGRYDIYARELTPDLIPIDEARRVSDGVVESYAPIAAFGPQGEIGVMFTGRDVGGAVPQVYFTSLSCEAGADFSFPQ